MYPQLGEARVVLALSDGMRLELRPAGIDQRRPGDPGVLTMYPAVMLGWLAARGPEAMPPEVIAVEFPASLVRSHHLTVQRDLIRAAAPDVLCAQEFLLRTHDPADPASGAGPELSG